MHPRQGWIDVYEHTNPFSQPDWKFGGEFVKVERILASSKSRVVKPFEREVDIELLFFHLESMDCTRRRSRMLFHMLWSTADRKGRTQCF